MAVDQLVHAIMLCGVTFLPVSFLSEAISAVLLFTSLLLEHCKCTVRQWLQLLVPSMQCCYVILLYDSHMR